MANSEGNGGGAPESSALPGCFILGAILTVFGGLIILYIAVFFVQTRAISKFTSDEPAAIEEFSPSDAQKEAARGKLFSIKAAATQSKRERILFSTDDINSLIATLDILKDYRGSAFVKNITDSGIEVQLTQPMRKSPFSSDHRYLNATFLLLPELRKRTVAFRVLDIESEKGEVPEQFVKNYDTIGFFRIDPENPDIKPHISKLSRVYVEEGVVVVETGEQPTG